MSPEQIVEFVKNNQIDPQWIVFRYSKMRAVLVLLYKIFFAGFLLGISGILFFNSQKPLTPDLKVTVYGLGSIGFIGLLVLLKHIYTMLYLTSNMIVLTSTEVLKSNCGTVESWNYSDISNVREYFTQQKNSMPTYYVEFTNKKSGKIVRLARGREFGPAQDIFSALSPKVSC